MHVLLFKEFSFEAAHWLPTFPDGHKCRRLHGHSFRVEVVVEGELDESKGFLIDYGDMARAIEPVRQRLDHYCLNDVAGLENPTSEMVARWIWRELKPSLSLLSRIVVHETCTSRCEYRGR